MLFLTASQVEFAGHSQLWHLLSLSLQGGLLLCWRGSEEPDQRKICCAAGGNRRCAVDGMIMVQVGSDTFSRRCSQKDPGVLLALNNIHFAPLFICLETGGVSFAVPSKVTSQTIRGYDLVLHFRSPVTRLSHFLLSLSSGSLCCFMSLSISAPSVCRFSCKGQETP